MTYWVGATPISGKYMWEEVISWVNSEQRSATRFTNEISRRRRMHCIGELAICRYRSGKNERNAEKLFVMGVIGCDHSRGACFARDLLWFLSFAS